MATSTQVTKFFKEMGVLCVNHTKLCIANGLGFVLPSVAMAQAALETGYGTSGLMTKANAYFGIKAGSSWTGKVYSSSTGEVYNGVSVVITATFRAYDTKAESVADYYNLITQSSRYAGGVSTAANILTPYTTIYNIWDGGYATDPDYVSKIMSIINNYNLTTWDGKINGELTDEELEQLAYSGTGLGSSAGSVNSSGTSITIAYPLEETVSLTSYEVNHKLEQEKAL